MVGKKERNNDLSRERGIQLIGPEVKEGMDRSCRGDKCSFNLFISLLLPKNVTFYFVLYH